MRCRRALSVGALALLAGLRAGAGNVAPVSLPNPQIPGFNFPESEATIITWVNEAGSGSAAAPAAFENLHLHGWGLWTALTMETAEADNGQRLRVFETWFTPQ